PRSVMRVALARPLQFVSTRQSEGCGDDRTRVRRDRRMAPIWRRNVARRGGGLSAIHGAARQSPLVTGSGAGLARVSLAPPLQLIFRLDSTRFGAVVLNVVALLAGAGCHHEPSGGAAPAASAPRSAAARDGVGARAADPLWLRARSDDPLEKAHLA